MKKFNPFYNFLNFCSLAQKRLQNYKKRKSKNNCTSLDELYKNISYSRYDAFKYAHAEWGNEYKISINEGIQWAQIGYAIQNNNSFLLRQSYVLLILASEIFIKALLIKFNMVVPRSHNLYELYIALPKHIKEKIERNVIINELPLINNQNIEVGVLKNFEQFLKYISNMFIELRYDYEKIKSNAEPIVPRKFINDLCYSLYKIVIKED